MVLRAALVGVALAAVGGCGRVPDSGVELGYRVAVTPALEQAAKRRLDALMIRGAEVRKEEGLLILRLPGADPETVLRVKRVFRPKGELHLSMAAPVAVQQKFNADGTVPAGYRVVANEERSRGGEYEAYGPKMLVETQPVIEGRHIVMAEPRQEMVPGGARWVTSLEMDAEGAQRFDAAAKKLYEMKPPGLIAILFDGVLKSAPAVQSPAFHGKAQISGAKDQDDAKDLALILRTGMLPIQLPEPEVERKYGK